MVPLADAPHVLPRVVRKAAVRARSVPAAPRLSVVIVNYRQWENTAALVRQLRGTAAMRRGALEIVIVDNHSPPHNVIGKLRRCPGVSLRRWGRNHGFARAVNEGCRLSRGEWLLLLNPDMSITRRFVDGVMRLADQFSADEPRAGLVGFHLRNSDGTRQLSSGPFPSLPATLSGLALPRSRRKYTDSFPHRRCRVPWVTGCCLLVRHDCWRDLRGFAEDFFLYYEDVDLCRRARGRGWSVWYEPALQAVHHHPIHARAVSPALRLVTRHSLLTYGARHWPAWQFQVLAGIVRVEAWARRVWAKYRRDRASADIAREMGAMARDLAHARPRRARRRVQRIVDAYANSLVSAVRAPDARAAGFIPAGPPR